MCFSKPCVIVTAISRQAPIVHSSAPGPRAQDILWVGCWLFGCCYNKPQKELPGGGGQCLKSPQVWMQSHFSFCGWLKMSSSSKNETKPYIGKHWGWFCSGWLFLISVPDTSHTNTHKHTHTYTPPPPLIFTRPPPPPPLIFKRSQRSKCDYLSLLLFSRQVWLFNDRMDCIQPDSSIHGILQARILELVAISYSRESFWPKDQTHISWISCIGRWILYHWVTREAW